MGSLSPGPRVAASQASCSFAHPVPQSATSLGLPAPDPQQVLSTRLPVSVTPTSLDECFFFISLVVGLPYSSFFCQFWLSFVFKLLLSFFWLCKEAQCVYLCLHLGRKSCFLQFFIVILLQLSQFPPLPSSHFNIFILTFLCLLFV